MISERVEILLEYLRTKINALFAAPLDTQRGVMHTLVHTLQIGASPEPIMEFTLYSSAMKLPKTIPASDPTVDSGFVRSGVMVEAEGIEPSSEHVRTPRLRV